MRKGCRVVVAIAGAALLLTTGLASGAVPDLPTGCKTGYDYAGVQQPKPASGIRSTLTNMSAPDVGSSGHVAGWIGVGGPAQGPNGTDEWIQAGYAGFAGGNSQIYYEVTQPNVAPMYHMVQENVTPNAKNLVAVTEVQPNGWQVSVNGQTVSPVINLPGSHGKFAPQAIGETWNGGTTVCNIYSYGFGNVQIAPNAGSPWVLGTAGYKWANKQQLLITTAAASYLTKSSATMSRTTSGVTAAAPTSYEPPLIGGIASSMLGHKLTTRCVPQRAAVTAQPGTLLVSNQICAIMIGYAVAEPRVPAPYSPAALQMARASLDFLRGIARASGTVFPNVDCGALTRFYQALKPLGATSAQAVALRKYLLHASIPLYLPHCPVH
jgi:hypothetical protein